MKRFGSRRTTRYAALLLALVLGAVVVVASAQATPTKKNVNVFVTHANPQSSCATAVGECFKVYVQNDGSSNVTLGSSNLTPPSGWTINSVTSPPDAGGHAWTACAGDGTTCGPPGNSVVQLRANSSGDSLSPGQSVTAYADVTTNCAASGNSALWSQETKQANNFSGQPGNDFQPKSLDLNPLGSFSTNSISSPVDLSVTPTVTFTATALDTCQQPKATDRTKVGAVAYTGAAPYASSVTALGLTGVPRPLGFTWGASNGIGSVTVSPTVSQFNNQFVVTDTVTGISATSLSDKPDNSNTFDVVAFLCTSNNTCQLNNASGHKAADTTINAPTPPFGDFLGLGFDDQLNDSGCNSGTRVGSISVVAPSADLGSGVGFYEVTFTYSKAASGTGSPSTFDFCYTQDEGQNWIVLLACSKTQPAPCVANRSRSSGGALQFVIDFPAGVVDPGVVPHH